MDLENQKRVKEFADEYGAENLVVVLGAAEGEAAGLAAETVTLGDPTFAGPLTGVQLGLTVYHVCEPEIKEEFDEAVYDEQVGMMEMVLDVDDIVSEMEAIREQVQKSCYEDGADPCVPTSGTALLFQNDERWKTAMNSVIKGASYVLAHTPQMVVYNGTTQTTERIVNPESEYLKELESHLRSYEDCVSYWPNQVYIGNATPDDLAEVEFPYYDKKKDGAERYGKYGEIMPEEEFILLVQACDQFEVVMLDKEFVAAHKEAFAADPIITEDIVERLHA